MFKVTIKKNGIMTHARDDFSSLEEAQAWQARHNLNGTFGRPAIYETISVCIQEEVRGMVQKLVAEPEFDGYGNEVTPAIYKSEEGVISPAVYEQREVLVSECEFEVIIEDITEKLEQERINQESLEFLASTDWLILRELDNGTPCPPEIKAERQAARDRIVK
jgi:hypothetical protein